MSSGAPPKHLFIYGTLCDPDLFRIVAGAPLRAFVPRRAIVIGARALFADGAAMPLLAQGSGAAPGLVLSGIDNRAWRRVCFYEDPDYAPKRVVARIPARSELMAAFAFVPTPAMRPTRKAWSPGAWTLRSKRRAAALARGYMAHFDAPLGVDLDAVWERLKNEFPA
jgi:Gamma-glutamyl cyclotransferase, AIG2-like